jgi:quinol monooxygenase YgiN
MIKHALFVRLEAKPGKEKELAQFLQDGLVMARQEGTTPVWFALRIGPSTFGIFDAFADEAGRQAHLNGPIAQALGANAPKLLVQALAQGKRRRGCFINRHSYPKTIIISIIKESNYSQNKRLGRRAKPRRGQVRAVASQDCRPLLAYASD